MRTTTLRLSQVKVGAAARKDMGNLAGLARSLKDVGLLQPVAVWPDHTLAFGLRRLKAAELLGWASIPAVVLESADDALARLKVERDENTERKQFTPMEVDALARQIEAAGLNLSPGQRAQEVIAGQAGVSVGQLHKIRAVARAAEDDPEAFGPVAAEMDRTGRVDPAYRQVRRARAEFPGSDLVAEWLKALRGFTDALRQHTPGVKSLLEDRTRWDWDLVRGELIPGLGAAAAEVLAFKALLEKAAKEKA